MKPAPQTCYSVLAVLGLLAIAWFVQIPAANQRSPEPHAAFEISRDDANGIAGERLVAYHQPGKVGPQEPLSQPEPPPRRSAVRTTLRPNSAAQPIQTGQSPSRPPVGFGQPLRPQGPPTNSSGVNSAGPGQFSGQFGGRTEGATNNQLGSSNEYYTPGRSNNDSFAPIESDQNVPGGLGDSGGSGLDLPSADRSQQESAYSSDLPSTFVPAPGTGPLPAGSAGALGTFGLPELSAPTTASGWSLNGGNLHGVNGASVAGGCGCDQCVAGNADAACCPGNCQPLCVTKTIWVPQWYTVYSTVNETHYRPEIREIPYFTEHSVTHQVPVIERFPVIVKQPRIRNYRVFRSEAYQEKKEVPYTVMVPKPKTREITTERQESYQVPEEEQYTVMVPKKKEVRKTKFRIVKDREPVYKEYVEMVPQQRKRIRIDYQTRTRTFVKKVPVYKMVEKQLQRQVTKYRTVTKKIQTTEEFFRYEKKPVSVNVPTLTAKETTIDDVESYLELTELPQKIDETIRIQKREPAEVTQTYTVSVPYTEEIEEFYYENQPYEETVRRSSPTKILTSREILKPYTVKIPYTEHVPETYYEQVPYEAFELKYRYIPKQVQETKYQLVKRDMGRWVTQSIRAQAYEIGQDECGCPTCCPKSRTIRQTRWVPNVVTQKLPYTTFKTVKLKIPYQSPVTRYRRVARQRMVEVPRFRTETRQKPERVYTYETSAKSREFKVTKFRLLRKSRTKKITRYREEERTKKVPVNRYVDDTETRSIDYVVTQAREKKRPIKLPAIQLDEGTVEDNYYRNVPVKDQRTITKTVTVREPYQDTETFTVKVPQIDYKLVNETEEYQEEVPVEVPYEVLVPEIRTRTEYVTVERKVPYVETSFVTEMVPEIKTRRVYKTRTRTVSEVRTQTFMTNEPELKTKTVYETKYRDVPVMKSELYWENVTQILRKTVFKPVTRTIRRPAIKRESINVPYQVQVRIPRQVCRLVPRQITIPIEPYCVDCCSQFTGLNHACGAYLQYGLSQIQQNYGRLTAWLANDRPTVNPRLAKATAGRKQ